MAIPPPGGSVPWQQAIWTPIARQSHYLSRSSVVVERCVCVPSRSPPNRSGTMPCRPNARPPQASSVRQGQSRPSIGVAPTPADAQASLLRQPPPPGLLTGERPTVRPSIVRGVLSNSPGDGPNQSSSGGICCGGTEGFSIGEDNSITVSLPPHHLTILSLVIA
jgi:hypothetical protein